MFIRLPSPPSPDCAICRSSSRIATHSPILMAYPDATIYLLDDGPPREAAYRDTEHYTVTRNFLLRTEQMLDVLLDRKAAEN
jgi:predicted ATPase